MAARPGELDAAGDARRAERGRDAHAVSIRRERVVLEHERKSAQDTLPVHPHGVAAFDRFVVYESPVTPLDLRVEVLKCEIEFAGVKRLEIGPHDLYVLLRHLLLLGAHGFEGFGSVRTQLCPCLLAVPELVPRREKHEQACAFFPSSARGVNAAEPSPRSPAYRLSRPSPRESTRVARLPDTTSPTRARAGERARE